MTYQFHVDQRFGHVTVTNESGTRLGDVIDLGASCALSGVDFMTPSEAFAIGSALQRWSLTKRTARAKATP